MNINTASNNNYNTLGKIGPHYEKPEYRPPSGQETEERQSGSIRPGDRSTLSVKNPGSKTAEPSLQRLERLHNVGAARLLSAQIADLIKKLPPESTTAEPHTRVPGSLLSPVYA